MMKLKEPLLKAIGPGFLLAGAAIGVSHLVQATRAGADYGFGLFWLLLLAIITKYPFLEFGPRYAAASGSHLISGYKHLGKLPYQIYIFITVGTMFIIQAAVTVVTAGLAEHLFGLGFSPAVWSALILGLCIILLIMGRYPGLDISMKVIISVLTICTFAAVVIALGAGTVRETLVADTPSYWNLAGLAFIIAFMGWMPIPLDASVWHSIWSNARARQTGYRPTIQEARFDFNLGYGAAALIGLMFFLLGALIMFGSGKSFSASSVQFSAELIDLYGLTLGSWSAPLVSVAAFVTMFSTTLAVTDAYPRVLTEIRSTWQKKPLTYKQRKLTYNITIFIVPSIAVLILTYLTGSFTVLVDFAAGLSFLAAPVLGWFNLKLVTSQYMPKEAHPTGAYLWFSYACLIFLILFSGIYLYWRFMIGGG